MKMLRPVFCFLLIAELLVTPVQAKEPITLRYKMTPDDRLVYRRTDEFTETRTANGIAAGAGKSVELTEVVVWTLESVDDAGNFHIRRENKRLRLKTQAGPLKFEYDSTAARFRRMRNTSFFAEHLRIAAIAGAFPRLRHNFVRKHVDWYRTGSSFDDRPVATRTLDCLRFCDLVVSGAIALAPDTNCRILRWTVLLLVLSFHHLPPKSIPMIVATSGESAAMG